MHLHRTGIVDLSANRHGIELKLLDLGGGFPGEKGTSIDPIADVINRSLDHHFPDGCGVKIIAEPGRYYVSSAFTLAARIFGRRRGILDDENLTQSTDPILYHYYSNDGAYCIFKKVFVDEYSMMPNVLEERPERQEKFMSCVWGPTCSAYDCPVPKCHLPILDIDDWLIFDDMGAYTFVLACRFNGFPIAKVVPIIQRDTWVTFIHQSPLENNQG